jgi:hypothetical protein
LANKKLPWQSTQPLDRLSELFNSLGNPEILHLLEISSIIDKEI